MESTTPNNNTNLTTAPGTGNSPAPAQKTPDPDPNQDQGKTQKKRERRKFALGVLTGVLVTALVFGVLVPALTGSGIAILSSAKDSAVNRASVQKLRQLEQLISDDYYEPETVTTEAKENGLYKGLLESLGDPYSEYYNEEEMCTLTVVMESTRGSGWSNGAYLSLESANGYVYGTARLESGTLDSVDIRVAPKDVYSVWHSGGGTDRFINYWVRNQYGENFVEAEYAYQTGGTHLIAWPCAHVGIEEPAEGSDSRSVELYPVPTSGKLTVRAEGLQKVDILDIGGRTIVSSTVATLDLSDLPNGMYFVRVTTTSGSSVQRIVKK